MSTQKEVALIFSREITGKAEALAKNLLALRTDLCVAIPKERDAIIAAFSDPLFSARELAEKAGRLEGMIRRGKE
jgi:hypothetical protein